jgi:hypothetical protein
MAKKPGLQAREAIHGRTAFGDWQELLAAEPAKFANGVHGSVGTLPVES